MKQQAHTHHNPRIRLVRVGLALTIGLWLTLMVVASGVRAALAAPADLTPTPTPTCPPGQFWDPFMNLCRPIKVECPAGLIDVNGDGSDCEALDPIPVPGGCLAAPTGPGLGQTGSVDCALPLRAGGNALIVSASIGCLNISRQPFPRAMVNLPVEYRVAQIIPPAQLRGIPFGAPGSYRLSSSNPWATEGLYLHERYGAVSPDSYGQPSFDTRALLAGDPHPYPNVTHVRARLIFRMVTTPNDLTWTTSSFPDVLQDGLSNWAKTTYSRSSFPLPEIAPLISLLGPAADGTNSLAGFKVQIRSRWNLYMNAEWDTFGVSDSHQYVFTGHHETEVQVAPTYDSYRAWDNRQSPANAEGIYCNAAQGFIPVPVIEAQTVLQ